MNILLICYGAPWESLCSSSLLKKLRSKYKDVSISFALQEDSECLFRYNDKIEDIYIGNKVIHTKFDRAINLTPTREAADLLASVDSSLSMGYGWGLDGVQPLNKGAEEVLPFLQGKSTQRNCFQVLFKIANMTWKGEGYDFVYYPRNKTKKNKTGIAIHDNRLRGYVKQNLKLNRSDLWHVPIRKNILKRIDEINRVNQIVTDDLLTLHASIAMRKHVEFLDINNLNMSVEFFGKGSHHKISHVAKQLHMQKE